MAMAAAEDEEGSAPRFFLRNDSEPEGRRRSTRVEDDGLYPVPGEAFVTRTEPWERFSVAAVRIDGANGGGTPDRETPPGGDADPAGPQPGPLPDGLQTALGELLESELPIREGAFWFLWREGLYGCVLPDVDAAAAQAWAQHFQISLADRRPETVTIGVAAFPLLTFSRAATFVNACKALDHAAFFGAGNRASFDAVSLNISGDQYYQRGDLQTAVAEYRQALRLDAANANVLNSLGVCQARLGDRQAARRSFETVLSITPDEPMAVYNLGIIHQMDGDNGRALQCFEKAFSLDEGTFEITLALGRLLVEQACWKRARPILEKARALRGDSPAVYSLLGRCLAAEGLDSEALTACSRAVKLNPNDAAALSALAELYAARGENADICLTFARQSVALAPGNGLFHFRLARLYEKFNRPEEALPEYERAASLGHAAKAEGEAAKCRLSPGEPEIRRQAC